MKYAVTINCNTIPKGELLQSYYIDQVQAMRKAGNLTAVAYEIGNQGRCHLHATWDTNLTSGQRHKLLYRAGYFYECKPVRVERAWDTYIRKDQPKATINITNIRLV